MTRQPNTPRTAAYSVFLAVTHANDGMSDVRTFATADLRDRYVSALPADARAVTELIDACPLDEAGTDAAIADVTAAQPAPSRPHKLDIPPAPKRLHNLDIPVRSGDDHVGRADAMNVDVFESPEGAIVCIAESSLTGEVWLAVSRSSAESIALATGAAHIGEVVYFPACVHAVRYSSGTPDGIAAALVVLLAEFQVNEMRAGAIARGEMREAYLRAEDLFVDLLAVDSKSIATIVHPMRGLVQVPASDLSDIVQSYGPYIHPHN